jgi:hypothetical protein
MIQRLNGGKLKTKIFTGIEFVAYFRDDSNGRNRLNWLDVRTLSDSMDVS